MNLIQNTFFHFVLGSSFFFLHTEPLMAVKTWNQILDSESWNDAITIAKRKRDACKIKAKSENATQSDKHSYTLWKLRLKGIRMQSSTYPDSYKPGRQLLLKEINEQEKIQEAWENYLDAKHAQQIDALREQKKKRKAKREIN